MSNSTPPNGSLRAISTFIGLIALMISIGLNAVQASTLAQTKEKITEYRVQQQEQEVRLRTVERAVEAIPYIREGQDRILRELSKLADRLEETH